MNIEKFHRTIKEVTDLLAQEAYHELETLSGGVRLKASDIKKTIKDYGRSIVQFPEQGYEMLDVIEVNGSMPKKWNVNVPVFTREEGESDLTLELTVIDSPSASYGVEIDNLHVL